MPMTTRQLAQVGEDYADFLPIGGEVVACEQASPGAKSTCDICGEPFQSEYHWKDIDGNACVSYGMRAAKQIVVHVAAFGLRIRHYRLLVCRQGVKCRSVRLEQMAAERKTVAVTSEPHVVPYAQVSP